MLFDRCIGRPLCPVTCLWMSNSQSVPPAIRPPSFKLCTSWACIDLHLPSVSFHSGLIQDHVVSGTLLAKRDTFFTRQEYSQLLFVGCTVWTSKAQGGASQAAMQLDPPTILKPQPMWTGKQVRRKGVSLPPTVNLAAGQHLKRI